MINAYDRMYLERMMTSFGRMLDYAVYDMKYDLEVFWNKFLVSDVSRQIEYRNVSFLTGRSGVELALLVDGKDRDYIKPHFSINRSEEYWLGWAVAYYQWKTCQSFHQITENVNIKEILKFYSPYHEMDIRQFCDRLYEVSMQRQKFSNLKKQRLAAGFSQSQLALLTGIPVRTIQQYEQKQKDINKARVEYIIALSSVLECNPKLLLEIGKI